MMPLCPILVSLVLPILYFDGLYVICRFILSPFIYILSKMPFFTAYTNINPCLCLCTVCMLDCEHSLFNDVRSIRSIGCLQTGGMLFIRTKFLEHLCVYSFPKEQMRIWACCTWRQHAQIFYLSGFPVSRAAGEGQWKTHWNLFWLGLFCLCRWELLQSLYLDILKPAIRVFPVLWRFWLCMTQTL